MSKLIRYKLCGGLILLLMVTIIASACTGEYKTYTFHHVSNPDARSLAQESNTTHFSFEYPRHYQLTSKYTREVTGAPIGIRFSGTKTNTTFGINIDYDNVDIQTDVDRMVHELGEFIHIYERTAITIDNVPGELIIYHDSRQPTSPEVMEAFFEYENRKWNIFIGSDLDSQEQAKGTFRHIIETFRFLQE